MFSNPNAIKKKLAQVSFRFKSLRYRLRPIFFLYVLHLIVRFLHYFYISNFGKEKKVMAFSNIESMPEFNFELPNRIEREGVCAMIRAKNEEDKILYSLGSVYDFFDQILIIDNGSTDKTVELVNSFKKKYDDQEKISIVSYPFKITRMGDEYGNTPADSVHSMVYYTNYAMSHCQYKWLFKWDADMLMRVEERQRFKEFLNKVKKGRYTRWAFVGQNLFRSPDGKYLTSAFDLDRETRLFPLSYHNRFMKTPDVNFEVLYSVMLRRRYSGVLYYEMKFSDANEFSHWTTTDELPTERWQREVRVLKKLQNTDRLDGYEVIEEDNIKKHAIYY